MKDIQEDGLNVLNGSYSVGSLLGDVVKEKEEEVSILSHNETNGSAGSDIVEFTLSRPANISGTDLSLNSPEKILSILLKEGELSEKEIMALRNHLGKFKKQAALLSKKIVALEFILDSGSKLEDQSEKKAAYQLMDVASCVHVKVDVDV